MKLSILMPLLLLPLSIFSQGISKLMKMPQYTTEVYDTTSVSGDFVQLRMDFAEAKILNWKDAKVLEDKQITSIDLVYTDFRTSPDFDQPDLNKKRLQDLQELVPLAFTRGHIRWRFIAQTECKTSSCAEKLFHGFIIGYREKPKEALTADLKLISETLEAIPREVDSVSFKTIEKVKKHREPSGYYLPKMKWKRSRGVLYDKPGIWKRRREFVVVKEYRIDTLKTMTFKPTEDAEEVLFQILPDSTVFAVMNRHTNWKGMHILTDVTGSMSLYYTQVIAWLQLNMEKRDIKYLTFFNDGDNMPDRKKKIGQTGGIYHVEALQYKTVEDKMMKAIRNGSGGDAPENNVEALRDGITRYSDQSDIILVVDNMAPVKDMELLPYVDRPVHVILCGASWGGVNVDYINLAYQTNGSIHSIEDDLYNLMELSEGEIIEILDQRFILKKGKFEPLYRL